ncbi:hypothetical protein DRO69_04905 [Candidatus Bathyarchaeota archaeon]|nr:MAG: hypothetical protein DRO69_04905 [Candidatus Bathyarchaeota archaeon]
MISKSEAPRFAILLIGVILLAFTFLNAYWFLQEDFSIISTSGIVDLFGEALGPLIEACIRAIYLGIMGWIGSIITIRGVQLLTSPKRETTPEVKTEPVPEVKPVTKKSGVARQPSTKVKGKKDK